MNNKASASQTETFFCRSKSQDYLKQILL